MDKIYFAIAAILTSSLLAACGECACNSYNKDYLRDVPVSSTRSFD